MVVVSSQKKNRRQTKRVLDAFTKIGLSDVYRRAVLLAGYRYLTTVQETAIPLTRLGNDLIVQSKSGTGKTLVFALACLERINCGAGHPQAIIISPNHQIAQQNGIEISKIANNLPHPNFGCAVLANDVLGASVHKDRRKLMRSCQVISGTPERFILLHDKHLLTLDGVRILVLDDVENLFKCETAKSHLESLLAAMPAARQSLAFSSVYSNETLAALEAHMDYPEHLFINNPQNQSSLSDNDDSGDGDKKEESGPSTPQSSYISSQFGNEEEEDSIQFNSISHPKLTVWKQSFEKRSLFWNYMNPSSHSTESESSQNDQEVTNANCKLTPSEHSTQSTGSSSRKSNCIRLPSRLSRTTSASSVVYSEEGDCEFEDEVIMESSPVDSAAGSSPSQLGSFVDLMEMREELDQWMKDYLIWQERYQHWFEKVGQKMKDSGLPMPPTPLQEMQVLP
eukprot:g8199.t1